MEFVLVKFQMDWADEFDVLGFKIYPRSEWLEIKTKIEENGDHRVGFWFGSNEGWEDEPIINFLESTTVEPIDEHEKNILEKLFYTEYRKQFGIFPDFKDWIQDL